MKKLLAIAVLFIVIGSSCKKEESVKPEIKTKQFNIERPTTQQWD